LTYSLGAVGDLALQVGEVYLVMVNQADVPHTTSRQKKGCTAAQTACANDQDMAVKQPLLS
jgi:hypothetical protein